MKAPRDHKLFERDLGCLDSDDIAHIGGSISGDGMVSAALNAFLSNNNTIEDMETETQKLITENDLVNPEVIVTNRTSWGYGEYCDFSLRGYVKMTDAEIVARKAKAAKDAEARKKVTERKAIRDAKAKVKAEQAERLQLEKLKEKYGESKK